MATKKKAKKTTKKKRIPLGGKKDILTFSGKEKGFVYRWINDKDGRIEGAKAGGYSMVESAANVGSEHIDNASVIGGTVSKNVGQGVTAYLMKIDEADYKEDQLDKQRDVDAKEEGLNDNSRELTGRYGGIEYKR